MLLHVRHPHPHLSPRRWRLLIAVTTTVALIVFAWASRDVRAAPTTPPLITDYPHYPDATTAQATTDCTADKLTGVSYQLNGGSHVATLAELGTLKAGDQVSFWWRGVPSECVGSWVSLAIKSSHYPTFHLEDNQATVAWATHVAADRGFGLIILELPPLDPNAGCSYQVDAILGIPLAVVGPTGSYYSPVSRGDTNRNMLVGAANGAYGTCDAAPTTTTAAPPPSTTTTAQPPTTAAPTTTIAAPATTTTTIDAPAAPTLMVKQDSLLPDTGFDTTDAILVALVLLAAGAFALMVRSDAKREG